MYDKKEFYEFNAQAFFIGAQCLFFLSLALGSTAMSAAYMNCAIISLSVSAFCGIRWLIARRKKDRA